MHIRVALDGTGYFTSISIGCERCSIRMPTNGEVQNFHAIYGASIVAPAVEAGGLQAALTYLSIDGAGVQVRKEEAEGVRSKGEGVEVKTCEPEKYVDSEA